MGMENKLQFYVSKYPVTKTQWDAVALWAFENGYIDLSVGWGNGNKPVGCISWYDAIKFCNALSELAGVEPVYYDETGKIYKEGFLSPCVKETSSGYRLPNQQEWEFACRGGTDTKYYWGNNIPEGNNPYAWTFNETNETTREVGGKLPSSLGLYDMLGNVYEWCFDSHGDFFKVIRGGSVALDSIIECGFVSFTSPNYKCYETGFRVFSSNYDAEEVGKIAKLSPYYGKFVEKKLEYPKMNFNSIEKRFYDMLIDGNKMKVMIDEGKPNEAMKSFRNSILGRMKNVKMPTKFSKVLMDEFENRSEKLMSLDVFDIKWHIGNFERDIHHNLDEMVFMAIKFYESKDVKYLNQYLVFLESFLVRNKAEYDVLTDEGLMQKSNVPISWAWGNGFDTAFRILYIMDSLRLIAKTLCEEDFDLFPEDLFAQMAVTVMSDNIYPVIKDGRNRIINQVMKTSGIIIAAANWFCDFKISNTVAEIGISRWRECLGKLVHPDGSVLEQSFNYNVSIMLYYFYVAEQFESENQLKGVGQMFENVFRMLCCVKLPTGGFPSIHPAAGLQPPILCVDNTEYMNYVYTDEYKENFKTVWKDWERIAERLWNKGVEVPQFTSVFFPYGGISILRDKWDLFGRYLFFISPRSGSGHTNEFVNEIQIEAFGRIMLTGGGAYSYSLEKHMDPTQLDMIEDIDHYFHNSHSRNTVLVDGSSQARLRYGEQLADVAYSDTVGYRWLDSENFVYTEGIFDEPYYNAEDVVHHREIIFDKESGLWFVFDTMSSEKPHTYTQNWSFMPKDIPIIRQTKSGNSYSWNSAGFSKEEVITDEDSNKVYTCDKGQPNIYLYHFGQKNISYQTFYGHKNPIRGWYAPNTYGLRYPNVNVHADWKSDGGESILLTVIEAVPNENSSIVKTSETKRGIEILMGNNDKFTISFKEGADNPSNSRILLKKNDIGLVIDDGDGKCYEFEGNQITNYIKAPSGMVWEDKDSYSKPVYIY